MTDRKAWTTSWLLSYGEPVQLHQLNSLDEFTPDGYSEIYINNAVEGILYVGCSDCSGYIMSEQTYKDTLLTYGISEPPKRGEWYWDTGDTVKRQGKSDD